MGNKLVFILLASLVLSGCDIEGMRSQTSANSVAASTSEPAPSSTTTTSSSTTTSVTTSTSTSTTMTTTTSSTTSTTITTTTTTTTLPAQGTLSIPATVFRIAGSGSTMVSSGIPLKPGLVFPSQASLDRVRVVVSGNEVDTFVEPLSGLHIDGSLRSVLVQFASNVTINNPLSAEIQIGDFQSVQRLGQKYPITTPVPDAAILPTEPSYLVSTLMAGPLVELAQAPTGSGFDEFESKFIQYSEYHWNGQGGQFLDNYYDRVKNHLSYWMRSGDPLYWHRAMLIQEEYLPTVVGKNGGIAPRSQQPEGLAMHYWLTGYEPSRDVLPEMAQNMSAYYTPARAGDPNHPGLEGRIQQRIMLAEMYSWLFGDTRRDWLAHIDERVSSWMALQQSGGNYRYEPTATPPNTQSNYMEALRMSAMIAYIEIRNPQGSVRADVVTSIKKQADYLWSVEWDATHEGFHYWGIEMWPEGDAQVSLVAGHARELNMLFAQPFAFLYDELADITYRDKADQMFVAAVTRSHWLFNYTKQFNIGYYSTFNYQYYRE